MSSRDVARSPPRGHVGIEHDGRRNAVEFVQLAGDPMAEHRAFAGREYRHPRVCEKRSRRTSHKKHCARALDPVAARDSEFDLAIAISGFARLASRKTPCWDRAVRASPGSTSRASRRPCSEWAGRGRLVDARVRVVDVIPRWTCDHVRNSGRGLRRRVRYSAGSRRTLMLLMQNRSSTGLPYFSPWKRWPRCDPHRAQRASMRRMP